MGKHQIFGNASAENDDLLFPCKVDKQNPSDKQPILSGRWGVGKSALLLLHNYEVYTFLKKCKDQGLSDIDDLELIWYLGENSLNGNTLKILCDEYAGMNKFFFVKAVEKLWKIEISRTYCIILSILNRYYFQFAKKEHWDYVTLKGAETEIQKRIWNFAPEILKSVFLGKISTTITNVSEKLSDLNSDILFTNIKKCLYDIKDDKMNPTIAIEPIETSTSNIEKDESIAQPIIDALLNVFKEHYEPNTFNGFNIRISLPWHRYEKSSPTFPQKIIRYIGEVRWTDDKLKDFINKRIEWEFKRINRSMNNKNRDPWTYLFDGPIPNDTCKPRVLEDSFSYFLRHTHHRPRDLQTLAYNVMVHNCEMHSHLLDEDDSLRETIKHSVIKNSFRHSGDIIGKAFLKEGERRFPKLIELKRCLNNLNVPFDSAQLAKRIKDKEIDITFNEALEILWESGVLGIMVIPNSEDATNNLETLFTKKHQRLYKNEDKEIIERWYFFEYNFSATIRSLYDKLVNSAGIITQYVIHPKLFEHFGIIPKDKAPIGI